MAKRFFSSESVAEGHPDKLCDQISDAVLDNVLRQDPQCRVACETYVTMGLVIIGGEISTSGYVDIRGIAQKVIKDVGYTHPKYGFDYNTCAIVSGIHNQSPDIAQGVNKGGAGDQGSMVGYACSETPEFMPLPIMLAHRLVQRMSEVRKKGILKYLGPDGKSQVTVEYENDKPRGVDSVVLACQHTEEILDETKNFITTQARQEITDTIVRPVLRNWIDKDTKYYINETGKFIIGGPQSDTGMTGRKIIVDTYGGSVPHGGGCFSGKDPTKVDRSATYMARYIAKNIVAAGLAKRCLIQLAYVIGRPEPLSIMVDTFKTSDIPEDKFVKAVRDNFDLTPRGIIKSLDLQKPIYLKTACYGHFGRSEFSWERLDRVKDLQRAL
jgi:S-adenosylmethionine synthetase